jgi:hypothetical protein
MEQILVRSAGQVGARTRGKASGDDRYHGSQSRCVQLVQLADRKVKVKGPRWRHTAEGEVTGLSQLRLVGENGGTSP